MRRNIVVAWLLLAAVFLLPVLLIGGEPLVGQNGTGGDFLPIHQTGSAGEVDGNRQVSLLLEDGTVEELSLADYLWGVVAAEMPASFEAEALKAQAVAARTYWASQCGTSRHEQAEICGDSSCCQAYISDARMEDSGCIAGGFQAGGRVVGHSLVYVSTKEPAKVRRAPWTVVYKTSLADGKTERLTPPGN